MLAVFGLLNGCLGYPLRATGWLPTVLLGSLTLGFVLPWTVVGVINLAQRRPAQALQGRVAAALSLALYAPLPIAQAGGAGMIAVLDYRYVYITAALVTGLTALWLRRRPAQRTPESAP